jgi:hypothetical protein
VTTEHPLQPTELDERGILRFKENRLISLMLTAYDQNRLCARYGVESWFRDDYDQLLQLIGYSVSGAPLSDKCRARVDVSATGAAPTFGEGYDAGSADTFCRIREALDGLESGE